MINRLKMHLNYDYNYNIALVFKIVGFIRNGKFDAYCIEQDLSR